MSYKEYRIDLTPDIEIHLSGRIIVPTVEGEFAEEFKALKNKIKQYETSNLAQKGVEKSTDGDVAPA